METKKAKFESYRKIELVNTETKKPACLFCETTENIVGCAYDIDHEKKMLVRWYVCGACAELFSKLSRNDLALRVKKFIEPKIDFITKKPMV